MLTAMLKFIESFAAFLLPPDDRSGAARAGRFLGFIVVLVVLLLIAVSIAHALVVGQRDRQEGDEYYFVVYLAAAAVTVAFLAGLFLLLYRLLQPRPRSRRPAAAPAPNAPLPESGARRAGSPIRRVLAGVLLTLGLGSAALVSVVTIMATEGSACFMLTKGTCEPLARYEITGEMTPVYLGEVSRNAPVSDTVHFSHRRSSCSNTSDEVFLACLPEGATVDSAVIRNGGGRNWGIYDKQGQPQQPGPGEGFTDFTNVDKDGNAVQEPPNCKAIRWKATSGGRTGIGECRYHGTIAFDVELAGTITRTEPGEVQGATETFENLPIARGLFEAGLSEGSPDQPVYTYRGTHPFPQILRWHYAATVDKRPRILGLLPGFTRTVSSETPGDGCVTSGLSDVGGLRIVEDC